MRNSPVTTDRWALVTDAIRSIMQRLVRLENEHSPTSPRYPGEFPDDAIEGQHVHQGVTRYRFMGSGAEFDTATVPDGWEPRWIWVGTYPGDPDTTADSPPFDNGSTNAGGGLRRLRFRHNTLGGVDFEGSVVVGIDGDSVTTVPAAYRPDEDIEAEGVGGVWLLQTDGKLIFTADASAPTSLPPSGAAGGSLDGTYPNPGIAASVAGSGLAETTNVLSVNVDGSTIEINSDTLRVKADGITANEIAAGAVGASEIASTAVTPASYGDATHVGAFTVDADGRLTAASSVAITGGAPSGSAGGVLDGTYPNPGLAAGVAGAGLAETSDVLSVNVDASTIEINADTLRVKADGITANEIAAGAVGASEIASTAVTPASYGDATHVGAFTVDADGRLTAASSVPITATGGSVATDAIWDTKGDVVAATGADAAVKVAVGSNGQVLTADSSQTAGVKWAAAGAGFGGSVKLYDFTITGSDQASIDTNVDGTTVANFAGYDILEVWIIARTDEAAAAINYNLNVNNDTGGNYDVQQVAGHNATSSIAATLADTKWSLLGHGSGGTAGYPALARLTIPGYAATTFNKVGELTHGSIDTTAANNWTLLYTIGWRSTAAITRLKVSAVGAAKLKVGSRLVVYGR